MSAAQGNGAPAEGPPKGGDAKRDDTIVKVTGVAIATGIAYSLYKSVFAGKKAEEPLGATESEPDKICVSKPEGVKEFEAGAKDFKGSVEEKGKDFKGSVEEKSKDFKGSVEERGRAAKSAAERKGEEVKEAVEEGQEKAAEQESKTKQNWLGWFSWLGGQAKEKKDEAGSEAEKAKEATKETIEERQKSAEKKGNNFFDKADEEIIKGKEEVEKGLAAAESKVEKAGAAVVHNVHKMTPGSKPHGYKPKKGFREYAIVSGDTLWSISIRHGVSIDSLKSANGIWNADFIVAGDTLVIPK